nr:hypothetical protein [Tanacetum cinerariifolium]
ENLGKLQPKADIRIFIGYAPTKKAFRVYNRHSRRIVETIHVDFDELTAMASEQSSLGPALNEMTPGTISSGLVLKSSPSTSYLPPLRNDWDLLFQPMFDELLNPPPSVDHQAAEVIASIANVIPPVHADSTGSPSSTTVDQDAPSLSKSHLTTEIQSSVIPQDVEDDHLDMEVAHMGNDPLFGVSIMEVTSVQMANNKQKPKPGSSNTDEVTGSKPGVLDVPTDESKEEISWNSSDDEGADDQEKVDDDDEGDKGNDSEEGKEDDDEEDKDGDERDADNEDQEVDDEETSVEESFDPIPRIPKSSEDEGNCKENQGLNVNKEEENIEEEEEDTQDVEDSHVTLTPINSNGQQKSLSVSSQFVTNMLNPTSDASMESIFATASTSVAPLPITAPTMTPSTVTTITTTSQAPIPPTPIPSEALQNLPTFASVFHFDDRLRIEQAVNEQLEAEVLTRSSHSSRTSYAVAADLSEMELKKILIEKMEGNKSIQRLDAQRNLYKILIEKMEGNKSIQRLDAQRNLYKVLVDAHESDKIILDTYGETVTLKRRCDNDEDKDEEPSDRPDREEPVQTTSQMEEPSHLEFETGAEDQPIVQHSQYPEWFSQPKKPPTSDRDWNKTLPAGRKHQQFYRFAVNRESARDVYSKRKIIAVTELKIVEWYNYKHLDWITVRRDDDNLYKFKEGVLKRLRLQDIEYILLLLVHGKLSNLTVEERFAFNVSLRMFTRSIVIQRRVEDLQLGVESYQKRLNLTKPDTYRSAMKLREAYTVYSNPRGFIYQNKDKKNRLMRIDKLHKFSDKTFNDVRTALDDRLKGIKMRYLPYTIWRKSDKDRAAAIIQAIDKMLKTRRIMRSLKKFVGGRLYEGDFQMLQRTI